MTVRKAIKVVGTVAVTYVVIVIAFEVFVVIVGKRQAEQGVQPGGDYLVLTTTAGGKAYDTVVAGVVSDGHVYVAANHWPRGWYARRQAHGLRRGARHGRGARTHRAGLPYAIPGPFPDRISTACVSAAGPTLNCL